ncbi:camp independent regulatory protein [Aspergillus heteromorphus CBS 117.55]|uniref:Camp independent regulatory protein n=1 Tax=Aspergillus heteromorphus CBS 117.55 TaxID=1448321 RepID=A0A317WFE7_9EURO|nr:camp independent regulatory protein [Aspergillus heteromorphus CBS 117.55]PWY82970.1 camp independent regulatory protein [Aspergillus heteromorphus CBS 117.55]
MVNGTATVLEPTFTGYVATTQDALVLFEACLTGVLHHVPRRPHDRERGHLVRSGSVFIYEENSSGIKRWTDGVTWSPSRILGNFLVYRELEKPFPPGEKKRAMKKANRRPVPPSRPGEPYPRQDSSGGYSPSSATTSPYGDRPHQTDVERALVGSLVDSYGFKDSGLVKKTMSVTVSGVTHHLVSYYSVEDVMRGLLNPPSMVDSLRYVRPRAELTQKQSFRAPIDDLETAGLEANDPSALYGYRPQLVAPPGYAIPNPHPEFYMHASAPYAATHPPPAAPISGYSMGGSISAQSAPNPYLPAPSAPTQIPQKPDDYAQFRTPTQYGTSFDALGHSSLSSSIPSALNMPSSLSDRNRSQSDHSPSAYRNSSISSRSVATDATSPIDPATPGTYSRGGSFSLGPLDGPHQALEQRGMAAFDPGIPRRESNPMPTPYYTGADRHPYYVGATGPAAHANYPVSTWTTAAPAQPQI